VASFVLIPGAGGAASYWQFVEPELLRRGHETVAVQLPASDDTAGFPEYADAVVAAAAALRGPLVVVAQSLGGFTAPAVCQRLPVSLVVLVNAMIPADGETCGAWSENTGSSDARRANDVQEGRSADGDFDEQTYFFHDVDRETMAVLTEEPPQQSEVVFGQVGLQGPWPDVPTRVLIGRDDRLFPADFQRRVSQERLGITPDVMPGGHLIALSRPAELAALLDSYAAAV
jgi:pimeloyl-ACP methyl ester carboxylesterase